MSRPSRLGPMPDAVAPRGREFDSQSKALLAAQAALEKHAGDVVVIDVRPLSTITDFFVICTAESSPQISALTHHVEEVLRQRGSPAWHTEGSAAVDNSSAGSVDTLRWVLMDCGDVVVHLLDQRARTFYRLEELWADAPRVPVPSS